MHLVVGGSGQLGTALVRQLVAAGKPVRAFVRPMSQYQHLIGEAVDLAFGDLRDVGSIRAAISGVDVVLANANIIAPRYGDTYEKVEGIGYESLIEEAGQQGVRRFVFASVPMSPMDDQVPQFRAKRQTENALIDSGVPYTILRCAPFMEVWLALPGSSVPLRARRIPPSTAHIPFCVGSAR